MRTLRRAAGRNSTLASRPFRRCKRTTPIGSWRCRCLSTQSVHGTGKLRRTIFLHDHQKKNAAGKNKIESFHVRLAISHGSVFFLVGFN